MPLDILQYRGRPPSKELLLQVSRAKVKNPWKIVQSPRTTLESLYIIFNFSRGFRRWMGFEDPLQQAVGSH